MTKGLEKNKKKATVIKAGTPEKKAAKTAPASTSAKTGNQVAKPLSVKTPMAKKGAMKQRPQPSKTT